MKSGWKLQLFFATRVMVSLIVILITTGFGIGGSS